MAEQTAVELVQIPERLEAKYTIIDACIRDGMQKSEIARGLRISPSSVTRVSQKINSKYDLTSKKIAKLAHKAVINTLQGLAVGESDVPKPSTILEAAKMHYDRAQPIVHKLEQSGPAISSIAGAICDLVDSVLDRQALPTNVIDVECVAAPDDKGGQA